MLNRGYISHLKKSPLYYNVFFKKPNNVIRKHIKLLNYSSLPFVKNSFAFFHSNYPAFRPLTSKKDLVPTAKEMAPRMKQFEDIKVKDKNTYLKIIHAYNEKDKIKKGHLEFIFAALKYMDDYGVTGDLETYKKLMDVFPKGKMIPKNLIQAEFYHFFRHQNCALNILDKMEYIGVQPDKEMGEIIKNVFGKSSHVFKKYCRMMYWMPKFKNLNPYQVPDPLPDDVRELARLALKKMSVDPRTKLIEYNAEELEDSVDKTWIMSAQSPVQQKLINGYQEDKAIFVEGPFLVWLRRISMTYYVLRADPKIYPEFDDDDDDDVSNLSLFMFGEKKPEYLIQRPSSVHEQEDGIIMGMCCTGTSSKDSLLSWIRFLRKTNPKLDNIPVLFKLRTSPTELVAINTDHKSQNFSEELKSDIKESFEGEMSDAKERAAQKTDSKQSS